MLEINHVVFFPPNKYKKSLQWRLGTRLGSCYNYLSKAVAAHREGWACFDSSYSWAVAAHREGGLVLIVYIHGQWLLIERGGLVLIVHSKQAHPVQ